MVTARSGWFPSLPGEALPRLCQSRTPGWMWNGGGSRQASRAPLDFKMMQVSSRSGDSDKTHRFQQPIPGVQG